MKAALENEIWERAGHRCEYCLMPHPADAVPFQIDHIVAKKHGGQSLLKNLALACFNCNNHKGANIAGVDPESDTLTRLFHPRQDVWTDHFQLTSNGRINGLSPVGRTTLFVLNINDMSSIALRRLLIADGKLTIRAE